MSQPSQLTKKINEDGGVIELSKSTKMTTVKGTLNVDEAVTLDDTLAVTGNTSLKGSLQVIGSRKIQTFAGSLADTSGTYADNDCLVELGTLDTFLPSGLETGTKFFIHKAVIGIKTAAGATLLGNLALSTTSGTATNAAVSGTEIVGADVTTFNPQLSATQTITEIDINFNNTAGNYHVFTPYVTAPIANIYLYARSTTTVSSSVVNGRFTVELEYSVY